MLKNHQRLRTFLTGVAFAGVCSFAGASAAYAQDPAQQSDDGEGSRQIMFDMTKNRPKPAAQSSPQTSRTPVKRSYHRVPSRSGSTARNAGNNNTTSTTPVRNTPAAGAEFSQVGVTFWRLRPSKPTDTGPKVTVNEDGRALSLTPERVASETPLKAGERVRITIESPRKGYLYVIDRDQYADGTSGDPLLIFPTTRIRGGDNSVEGGRLVEIPDQESNPPYFKVTPSKPTQVGEWLTILVTPKPLDELTIGRSPLKLDPAQVAKWEAQWGVKAEQYEMDGGPGQTWTAAEQAAAGSQGRSLTMEEPVPQTIYRVPTKAGNPLMVTVPLLYGSSPSTAVKPSTK